MDDHNGEWVRDVWANATEVLIDTRLKSTDQGQGQVENHSRALEQGDRGQEWSLFGRVGGMGRGGAEPP